MRLQRHAGPLFHCHQQQQQQQQQQQKRRQRCRGQAIERTPSGHGIGSCSSTGCAAPLQPAGRTAGPARLHDPASAAPRSAPAPGERDCHHRALGTPLEAMAEAVREMKNVATSILTGADAEEAGFYFDYIVGALS